MPSRARRLARASRIDPHAYGRAPVLAAVECVALAHSLRRTRPKDVSPHEQRRLERVLAAAEEVRAALDERNDLQLLKVRPKLDDFIAGWSCCCEILDGCARLPTAIGSRARDLRRILFATGRLSFLSADATYALSEAQRRLQRLAGESSRDALAAVVGEEVVAFLETATNELAHAIGLGASPRRTQEPGLIARRVREVQAAVASYGCALYGSVDEHDADSRERFRRAVAPIDELRSAQAARASRRASAQSRADAVLALTPASDASLSLPPPAPRPDSDVLPAVREERHATPRTTTR